MLLKFIKFLIKWIILPCLIIYATSYFFNFQHPVEICLIWIFLLYFIFYIKYNWKKEKETKAKKERILKEQVKNKIIKQIKIQDKYNNKDYLILTDKNEFFILKDNNDNLKTFEIKNYDYSIKNIIKEIDSKLVQIPNGYDVSNKEIYQWKFYLKNGNKLVYQIDYELHNEIENLMLNYFSKK